MYTTTINQNGMILINKAVREALGLKLGDKVTVTFDTQSARVERKMNDEEFMDGISKIQAKYGDKSSNGLSADEAVRVFREGKAKKTNNYYKEKFA